MSGICAACTNPRAIGHYLCGNCWGQLSGAARRQLLRRDSYAVRRLRALYDAIHAGVPLPLITIPPGPIPGDIQKGPDRL